MIGATDEELNELAVIIGMPSFWSNVSHALNYDYNTFVQELQQMEEHVTKKKINNYN
jgi:hypothetical protein